MKNKIIPLDEKIVFNPDGINWASEKNIKSSLQNFQEELKEIDLIEMAEKKRKNKESFNVNHLFRKEIDKLLLKHFGERLR